MSLIMLCVAGWLLATVLLCLYLKTKWKLEDAEYDRDGLIDLWGAIDRAYARKLRVFVRTQSLEALKEVLDHEISLDRRSQGRPTD